MHLVLSGNAEEVANKSEIIIKIAEEKNLKISAIFGDWRNRSNSCLHFELQGDSGVVNAFASELLKQDLAYEDGKCPTCNEVKK